MAVGSKVNEIDARVQPLIGWVGLNMLPVGDCMQPAGFKAKGDADALMELGAKYGLNVFIVDLVAEEQAPRVAEASSAIPVAEAAPVAVWDAFALDSHLDMGAEEGHQVSSTKVRVSVH